MLHCKKCGIDLTGTPARCPLCHGSLDGEPEGVDRYPYIPPENRIYDMPVRALALATVIAAVVCLGINYSLPDSGRWSVFVLAGLVSAWAAAGTALKKRGNPMKAILWQQCMVSLLVILWDAWTGFLGWSLDFVLPVLCLCSLTAMLMFALYRHLKSQEYLIYLLLNSLLGLLLLLPLLRGTVRFIYPSVICISVSVTVLAVLVLLKGSELKSELGRRLHL